MLKTSALHLITGLVLLLQKLLDKRTLNVNVFKLLTVLPDNVDELLSWALVDERTFFKKSLGQSKVFEFVNR